MEQYAAPFVFICAFIWYAFFSRESRGMRIWMCVGSFLLLLWLIP